MPAATDNYILPRNNQEWLRLQKQHDLWQKSIGYLIHRSGQSNLHAEARIADIGCGSASWLRDVAKTLPSSCQLDGFDIKPADQHAELPNNVHLHLHNVKEPFPVELHGEYNVAHIRLLRGALAVEEWAIVAGHVTQLLKPGGILQWEEPDVEEAVVINGKQDSTREGLTEMLFSLRELLKNKFGMNVEKGFDALPKQMSNWGLKVEEDILGSDRDPSTRTEMSLVNIQTALTISRTLAERDQTNGEASMARIDDLEKRAKEDIASGAYYWFKIHVYIGIKQP